ncbi:LytR/AlgR family response regulator transcription factor [Nesterenkonia flava]|uniref:LytTR family transcriptional regulator DNA-binding domain-containing protein n=1 Tax=Nesterenkonia flava TaxID=469799 RepID=A0ABU1FTK3_9MICC|nr:LytTR family transcriptional regulator DNA-binding domain-containing protein [Nesterenkonia flava]MDR5711974.1 LytTR family transcriptional regulator DNA-binding domain-containing protein [Nesterenkonia flava]
MVTALILDPDPLARGKLRRVLERVDGVEVLGEVTGPEEAVALLTRLDSEGHELSMSSVSGVQSTGLDDGRDTRSQGRNSATREQSNSRQDDDVEPLVRIPVHKDGRTVLVESDAIVYASAARGYSSLKLADEKVLVSFSLNELERRLHGHFFRVHRSSLVNLRYVRELVPDFRGSLVLVMGDRQRSRVEVSRRQARELRRRLGV